jgi:hypothetical protein
MPVIPERRLIKLEWPERVRAKDSDVIVLSLLIDDEGSVLSTQIPGHSVDELPVEIPNLYDSHNVVAVARLDLAGIDSWRDELREPVRPGRPVTFTWSVRAEEAGQYRGVVWLWMEFVPKDGGPVDSMTLLSRLIEIDAVTVLGLPGWLGRLVGGTGLLVSTVLGYPFVQAFVERLFRKRQVPAKQNPSESNKSA